MAKPFQEDFIHTLKEVHWSKPGFVVVAGFYEASGVQGRLYDSTGKVLGALPIHGSFDIETLSGAHKIITAVTSACGVAVKGKGVYGGYTQDGRSPPDIANIQQGGGPIILASLGKSFSAGPSVGGGSVLRPLSISPTKDDAFYCVYRNESESGGSVTLAKFSNRGSQVWTKPLGSVSGIASSCANADGGVAVAFNDSKINGYDPDGKQLWSISSGGSSGNITVLSQGATKSAFVYFLFQSSQIVKADIVTGKTIWSTSVGNTVSVDIAPNGSVFCLTDSGASTAIVKLSDIKNEEGKVTGAKRVWTTTVAANGEFGSGDISGIGRSIVSPGGIVATAHQFGVAAESSSDLTSTVYAFDQKTGARKWQQTYGFLPGTSNTSADAGTVASSIGRNIS